MDNFPRGSEWRRWDLHVHTKYTSKNDQFTSTDFNSFCISFFKKAIAKKIAVIGITDYFNIDNYKKVKHFISEIDNNTNFDETEIEYIKTIFILPNVELRILPVTDSGRLVNIHCLFNPLFEDKLDNNFFNALHHSGGSGNKFPMNRRGFIDLGLSINPSLKTEKEQYKKGIDNFIISHESLQKLIDENVSFRENTIIVVSNSNRDGASAFQKHYDLFEDRDTSSLDGLRKSIYCLSHAIFSSNEEDRNYFLGKKKDDSDTVISKCGSLKPCIHGCDAHTEDKLFSPDNNRYCWVKADPTFNGLKQIVYEPDERVRIQENNPEFEFNKPFIDGFIVKDLMPVYKTTNNNVYFKSSEYIPFNKGLVAIIGGRGAGKSILVNYIASTLGQYNKDDLSKSDNFTVKYSKNNIPMPDMAAINGGSNDKINLIFIPQGKLKEMSDLNKDIGYEIKKLLGVENIQFNQYLQEEIDKLLLEIDSIIKWFYIKDESGNNIYFKKFNDNIIAENENLLSSITTKENKEKLEKYAVNFDKLNDLKFSKAYLSNIVTSLNNYSIEFNKIIAPIIDKYSLTKPDFNIQIKELEKHMEDIEKEIISYHNENINIKNEFQNIYTGDLVALLHNVETYKKQISEANNRLELYKEKETLLISLQKEKKNVIKKIKDEYILQAKSLNDAWANIFDSFESEEHKKIIQEILSGINISIQGHIKFDETYFYNELKRYLNLTYFKNTIEKTQEQRIKDEFQIYDFNSYIDFMENRLDNYLHDEELSKKTTDSLDSLFFGITNRSKYLYTLPIITYQGKSIDKLSVGQRGTIYLCLQLATNAFSCPIIFDQPEDDLDNEFIIKQLIDIFKKIKLYRQVIIVTHNANLVVNADAEQIIVANNISEEMSYISGSLENKVIIRNVCDILEGGKAAFEKRENKYGF